MKSKLKSKLVKIDSSCSLVTIYDIVLSLYSASSAKNLTKEFDQVSQEILLDMLLHYGIPIRGIVHSWFRSYLSDRTQFVSIDDHNSSIKCIKYGVPLPHYHKAVSLGLHFSS
jgi:hypothetical protein